MDNEYFFTNSHVSMILFFILLLISVLGIIFMIYFGFRKISFLNVRKLIIHMYLEEYIITIILSTWIFYLFNLPVALAIWTCCYILINFIFIKNKMIRYICNMEPEIAMKCLKKETAKPIHLYNLKSVIANKLYVAKLGLKWYDCFLKYKTSFGLGLLVATASIVLRNVENVELFESLFSNITILTTVLYYIYKVAYWSCVENEASKWHDQKCFFNLQYTLYSLIFYIIIIAVTLAM